MFSSNVAYSQFEGPALDSGTFFLKTYEMHGEEDVELSCKRVKLKYYYYGERYGFQTEDGLILLLSPLNNNGTLAVDSNGEKWLVAVSLFDDRKRMGTDQAYRKISTDEQFFMTGVHYQISTKNVCRKRRRI